MNRYLADMCSLDRKIFGRTAWKEHNFRRPLSKKFELSSVAIHRKKAIGYLVASEYGGKYVHVHRLAVDSHFRNKRIGARLLSRLERACSGTNIVSVTLESLRSRRDANSFYEHMKFVRISAQELAEYLKEKHKTRFRHRYFGLTPTGEVLVYKKSQNKNITNRTS
ncbi:MAG: GNAT family N-acetyltransferase [Candidatus Bathyarchaeia archaeon]